MAAPALIRTPAPSFLQPDARLAYSAWAEETGSEVPFDRLSNAELSGWVAAVGAVLEQERDEPTCDCGEFLVCPDCDGYEEIPEPPPLILLWAPM
jgi:hypothetical protein